MSDEKLDGKLVDEIIHNILYHIRTKAEIKRCGCPECQAALKRLAGRK